MYGQNLGVMHGSELLQAFFPYAREIKVHSEAHLWKKSCKNNCTKKELVKKPIYFLSQGLYPSCFSDPKHQPAKAQLFAKCSDTVLKCYRQLYKLYWFLYDLQEDKSWRIKEEGNMWKRETWNFYWLQRDDIWVWKAYH